MIYQNPLSIFSESQLEQIYEGNLKAVKKELLLQFQLENSVTINLNGKELDKNGVLHLIDGIEDDLGLHSDIYKNKNLLKFLEDGNLQLFEDKASEEYEVEEKFYDRILEMILTKLNDMTGQMVSNPNFKTTRALKSIFKFTESLESHQKIQAYQKAYEIISHKVRKITTNFRSPFKPNSRREFLPQIHEFVDINFYSQFKHLPAHFDSALRTYGIWCNNIVVAEALEKKHKFKDFEKDTLRTIAKAAEIASNHHNTSGNLSIVRQINEYLAGNNNGAGISIFFFVIFVIVKLAGIMTKDYSSSSNTLSNSRVTTAVVDYSKGYFDSSPEILEHADFTELIYKCNIIPTGVKKNYLKIPREIKEKYQGQQRKINLTYQDKDLEKTTLTFNTLFDFTQEHFTFEVLTPKKDLPGKLKLTTTSMDYDNMKSVSNKFISAIGQSTNTHKANISASTSTTFHVRESNRTEFIIELKKDSTRKRRNDIQFHDRFTTNILKNLKTLNDITLYPNGTSNNHRIAIAIPIGEITIPGTTVADFSIVSCGNDEQALLVANGSNYTGLGIIDLKKDKLIHYQEVHSSSSMHAQSIQPYAYVTKIKLE